MAKKKVKVMTPTCIAPIPFSSYVRKCLDVSVYSRIRTYNNPHRRGLTLAELVVVIVILSLFVFLAVMSLSGLLRKNTFEMQAREFVSTMQMAAVAAAQSNRRYEVIIDLTEQSYTLRQINSPDLFEVFEEDIIATNVFSADCQILYVLFDDLMETDEDHQIAKFRAGHAGWQYGGKIVLLDEQEQPYSVLVSRMNRVVTLKKGDVEFLLPRAKDEVLF
ncbi:MAG: prepilin-type N-terminal cleavage/methylation domain-containing protein [Phycisphaerae bacterium]|nr:prepilin-type N-terminal cleavage/methylation domain-containing protein [Phycisphaerae bacterium]NIR67396.1 prepilin-type N-terminal cleavage/methylation domain-containing protein [candidate division Zixibacteria bacterium]NIS52469.1 prepilin-type N-terminal cleavage/methylation domain-containing protein [Phycisphaerae bacterium]NIU09988.1 prepilin-type N-terminal cleavage/methylation domain-containing protein [Phycisphaerae bacterium]NIU57723.1 prepilin-type N-terminal cleavage/methylation 